MTDQEINEAVARKLGWTQLFRSDNIGRIETAGKKNPEDDFNTTVPDYCHSIEAAWGVVEYLQAHGYIFGISNNPIEKNWHCAIRHSKSLCEEWGNTVPMAIALAFLKLKD